MKVSDTCMLGNASFEDAWCIKVHMHPKIHDNLTLALSLSHRYAHTHTLSLSPSLTFIYKQADKSTTQVHGQWPINNARLVQSTCLIHLSMFSEFCKSWPTLLL